MMNRLRIFILLILTSFQVHGQFANPNFLTDGLYGPELHQIIDLDLDGDMDVVLAARFDSEIVWYENLGNNSFSQKKVIVNWFSIDIARFHVLDVDDDGDLDVIYFSDQSFTAPNQSIRWIENDGFNVYTTIHTIDTGLNKFTDSKILDFNNDGKIDLLISTTNTNKGMFGMKN